MTARIWLYAASNSLAGAEDTFALASRWGIVWRPFYADRSPQQAIPNVRHLSPGDTLYLGYRALGGISLLGRMILGAPDSPETCSPVFTAVPESLISEFRKHGYRDDPVLGRMIGLFVAEVEPIKGLVKAPSRLTINELKQDVEAATGTSVPATNITIKSPMVPIVPATNRNPTFSPRGKDESFVAIGIDVGARPHKGFDLCRVEWANGRVADLKFASQQHSEPMPPTDSLRSHVSCGDVSSLAELTHPSASKTAAALWPVIEKLAAGALNGVFIDSPSGFSRNRLGHGRLTEKKSLKGVSFQSTPSLCCGREHGGDWAWLIYGMVAFASCLHRGGFTLEDWLFALNEGLYQPSTSASIAIRECFPTASISVIRGRGAAELVKELLPNSCVESKIVHEYLDHGIGGIKDSKPEFDRADG